MLLYCYISYVNNDTFICTHLFFFRLWKCYVHTYVVDFPYASGQHSVLLVPEEDYKSCNIGNLIASDHGAGDMVITLVSSETYYFICGVPGHCEQGLRLAVPVKPWNEPSNKPTILPPPPPHEVTTPIYSAPPTPPTPIYSAPPTLTPPTPISSTETPPYYSPPPQLSSSTKSPSYYSNNPTFHPNSAMASQPMSIIAHLTIIALTFACALFIIS